MARDRKAEQVRADANRQVRAARQAKQRVRDDKRRAEDEENRKALEARRLAGKNNGRHNQHG